VDEKKRWFIHDDVIIRLINDIEMNH
jgi:hypothetical protein